MRSIIIILVFFFSIPLFAQTSGTLEETLQSLSEDAARNYLDPVASGFGADLNAGWFHRAADDDVLGFDIEFGFVAMAAKFPGSATHFSNSGSFRFSQDQARQILSNNSSDWNKLSQDQQNSMVSLFVSQNFSVGMEGATIIGATDDYFTVHFPGQSINDPSTNQSVTVPDQDVQLQIGGFGDLAQLDYVPLAAPQFSLGTVFGTMATMRYLPDVELQNDLGKMTYSGFGLQHNPAVWMPLPLPFDVSLSYFTQTLKIGKLFNTKTNAFGINVSKQFGFDALNLTPYAGYMFESSTMNVQYDFIVESPAGPLTQHINFDITGANTSRLTLGLGIRVLIFNINADYNIGTYNSVSAGIFFAI